MSIMDFASAAQIAAPGMTMAAPGSLASTAMSAGRSMASEVAQFSHVGLTMRFKVTVSNYGTLGHWTSCDGLKVDFKYDVVRSGGDYGSTHVLPQNVAFGPVTLKRAVEAVYSETVKRWLTSMFVIWNTEQGEYKSQNTITIELFDVYQLRPVATWTLQGAFPVSWSGPQLSAKGSDIAFETLVLEHDGFLGKLP